MTEESRAAEATEETRTPDGAAEDTKESGDEAEDQDEDADDAGESADEDEGDGDAEPPKPKRKSRAQERIRELNRRLKREEAANAQLYAELRKTQATSPQTETKADAPSGRPREEDFDTTEQWIEAVTDWKLDERERAREARAQEQKTQADRQRPIEELYEKLQTADPYILEDFHKDARPDLHFNETVLAALNDAEKPAEVMRWLGSNAGELNRIARLSPTGIGRAIATIEAQLGSRPQPKKATDAPPPEKRVKGGGGTGIVKDPKDMKMAEYRQWREGGGGT